MPVKYTYDEIVLVCELVRENDWKPLGPDDPRVGRLSRLLQAAPIHPLESRDAKFRNTDGIARKSSDLTTSRETYAGKKTKGNRLDPLVLGEFLRDPPRMARYANAVREALEGGELSLVDLRPGDGWVDESEAEGRVLLALQKRRERSPKLRKRKIASAKRAGLSISCEVCGFDFRATYGERGVDFVEVHHRVPLHVSGETRTSVEDLIMLCSNCHRVVHRYQPWLSIEELTALIELRQ